MYRMNLADLFSDPHPYFAVGMLDDLPLHVKGTLQSESNGGMWKRVKPMCSDSIGP